MTLKQSPEPAPEEATLKQLGDRLRTIFPPADHDSVDGDMTRLLLHLSHERKPGGRR